MNMVAANVDIALEERLQNVSAVESHSLSRKRLRQPNVHLSRSKLAVGTSPLVVIAVSLYNDLMRSGSVDLEVDMENMDDVLEGPQDCYMKSTVGALTMPIHPES